MNSSLIFANNSKLCDATTFHCQNPNSLTCPSPLQVLCSLGIARKQAGSPRSSVEAGDPHWWCFAALEWCTQFLPGKCKSVSGCSLSYLLCECSEMNFWATVGVQRAVPAPCISGEDSCKGVNDALPDGKVNGFGVKAEWQQGLFGYGNVLEQFWAC